MTKWWFLLVIGIIGVIVSVHEKNVIGSAAAGFNIGVATSNLIAISAAWWLARHSKNSGEK